MTSRMRAFWGALSCLVVLMICQASCAFFDDGYEEYFSEEELRNSVQDMPRRFVVEGEEGVVMHVFVDVKSYGEFTPRGYSDVPPGIYPRPGSDSVALAPVLRSWGWRAPELISSAYASGARNVGNSLEMSCDAEVLVRDAGGEILFERTFVDTWCSYGRGYEYALSEDSLSEHEFLSVSYSQNRTMFQMTAARLGDEPIEVKVENSAPYVGTPHLRVDDEYVYEAPTR